MSRRFPENRSVSRKLGSKSPKPLFVIVCEGKNTEPRYITDFAKAHGNNLVRIELDRGAGAPLTIVQKAVETKKRILAENRKNGFDSFFEVWAVFDVDEHPQIPRAMDMGLANGIQIIVSNPCVEIWPLLHFEFHRAPIHRHDIQKRLSTFMVSYADKGDKVIDFPQIEGNYDQARTRARTLLEDHLAVGDERGNPSTNIFELLDKIKEHGKP